MPERGGPQRVPRPQLWRPGRDAPWPSPYQGELGLRDVEDALGRFESTDTVRSHVPAPPGADRRSAVLIALYDGAFGATTILTRRPLHMRNHAGEVAFPGGAIDDTDETAWDAALREAHEEVGLDPALPRQLGRLDRFVTGASYSLVAPWVAALDEAPKLTPSDDEVDEILHVPLRELLDPGVYREELWMWDGAERDIHFFELVGDTVWGATAMMLTQLLRVVTRT